MEVAAIDEICHLRLHVVDNFDIRLLGLRWLKSRHKRGQEGGLVCLSVLSVEQARCHHVSGAPVEVNLPAAGLTLDHDFSACVVLLCYDGMLWDAQILDFRATLKAYFVAELIREGLCGQTVA